MTPRPNRPRPPLRRRPGFALVAAALAFFIVGFALTVLFARENHSMARDLVGGGALVALLVAAILGLVATYRGASQGMKRER